jgi:GNAT superfamily N-acetyltransferase
VKLNIRPATQADAELIARLNEDVQSLHVANEPRFFKPTNPEELRAWHAASLSRPTCRAWIAEVGGEAIGYAIAELRQRAANVFAPEYGWMEVDQVAVLPSHHRRGVATALLEAAVAKAREEGIRELQLSAWEFNAPAQAAFTSFGFRPMQHRFSLELTRSEEP